MKNLTDEQKIMAVSGGLILITIIAAAIHWLAVGF